LGLKLITISIDNYFIDRDLTPLDDDGKPDYESLDALNLELLNENLSDLLQGKTVKLPIYNFFTGKSSISDREITLNQNEMIVIEGIHCLNDKLTSSINPKEKYKIYISALTQINLDDNNRIPTTDNRLLRRMVRDYKYRGHSAKKTFQMWPSVRNGEEKYIFPFQNNADGYLNTALDYELAVLKQFAEPLLMQIKPFDEEYSEAVRLQKFLSYIISAPTANVPSTSILREFIGGSFFEY
jgi:uridine kinase